MKGERIDLRTISLNDFIAYLANRNISYKKFIVGGLLNKSVTSIEPDHFRMKKRFFMLSLKNKLIKQRWINLYF
jgi:hypothetical protein